MRIIEFDKLVNEYLEEINSDEFEDYIIEINKVDYNLRPCFAFVSDKFVGEPLRLYLNSYTEKEKACIDDFSLASDYYFEDLETNEIKID